MSAKGLLPFPPENPDASLRRSERHVADKPMLKCRAEKMTVVMGLESLTGCSPWRITIAWRALSCQDSAAGNLKQKWWSLPFFFWWFSPMDGHCEEVDNLVSVSAEHAPFTPGEEPGEKW